MNDPFYRVLGSLNWPCSVRFHCRHHYCSFQYSCQSAQLAKRVLSVFMTCFLGYYWYFVHPSGCATSFSWVPLAYFALIDSMTSSAWPQLFAAGEPASFLSWLLLASWSREWVFRRIWVSNLWVFSHSKRSAPRFFEKHYRCRRLYQSLSPDSLPMYAPRQKGPLTESRRSAYYCSCYACDPSLETRERWVTGVSARRHVEQWQILASW